MPGAAKTPTKARSRARAELADAGGLNGALAPKRPWPARAIAPRSRKNTITSRAALRFAPEAALPVFVPPQLASLVRHVPPGGEWLHEVKFDGYRGQLRIAAGQAQFLTRNGLDWTARFRPIAKAAGALNVAAAIIDGEAVVLTKEGVSDFGALQLALTEGRYQDIVYFAFDLLHLDGHDLRSLPLDERKKLLRSIIASDNRSPLQYSDHMLEQGGKLYEHACAVQLEGIVSKRRVAPYVSGRGEHWVKVKCTQRQELVIGGWRPYALLSRPVGSLLVGYFKGDDFVFAGKVGTGLNERNAKDLLRRLNGLAQDKPPFASLPRTERKPATWVVPRIVVEVEFTQWTRDGQLRHPSFKGVREDKVAREVKMELPRAPA